MTVQGDVLNRVVELSQEMAIFMQEAGHPKAIDFKDEKFLLILSYPADIFGQLNALKYLMYHLKEKISIKFFAVKKFRFLKKNCHYGKIVFSKVTWQIFLLYMKEYRRNTSTKFYYGCS